MDLVLLLEAAQDRDRVFEGRLRHEHRLEPARQGGVLFYVLAVFIEGRRANAMQFAARKGRLQQVRRIHRTFGGAGADQRMQLVDEQNDRSGGRINFGQHRFQPLFEFTAKLGPGDQRAEVENQQALVTQAVGHVAVDDALGQAFDDRRLADPRFADQHRVVLGAPGQNLNRAADFLVAADHRIELAVARRLGQVAGVLAEGVVAFLGGRAVGGAALAHLLDRRVEALGGDAALMQRLCRRRAGRRRERLEQALGGDEAVPGLFGNVLGGITDARRFGREHDVSGARAFDLGDCRKRRVDGRIDAGRIAAAGANQVRREAIGVFEQHLQQMFGCKPLVPASPRQTLGGLQESPGAVGKLLELHRHAPSNRQRSRPAPEHGRPNGPPHRRGPLGAASHGH